MEERMVKTVSIATLVSKTLVDDVFGEGDEQAARALLTMVIREVRKHTQTAFEGRPFELTGLKLRLGPVPVSFFIPVPQDGRTWAVNVEVRAVEKGAATARSESGSAGAGGDA